MVCWYLWSQRCDMLQKYSISYYDFGIVDSTRSMEASYGITALSPKGYPIEIFSEVNAKYLCSICNLTLKNPVQSFCGHRFCKECFEHKMRYIHRSVASK